MASLRSLLRSSSTAGASTSRLGSSALGLRSFGASPPALAPGSGSRPKPDVHAPFVRMAPPRRASLMERMSPVDQAELGQAAAPPAMRPFNKGDILSPGELKMRSLAPKIRSKPLRKALVSPPNSQVRPYDPFLALGIDPTNEYLNGRMLSAFVTPVGRIKTRAENGLLPRSQRRVRKAIKRAQAMGLMGRWNNLDGLGEKRPVAREGHGLGRDWSLVDGGREPKIDQKQ